MPSLEQVKAAIQSQLPDARVQIRDLTGGGDHLEAIIVSAEFAGKNRVQQHQLVYRAVNEAMETGALHALSLKTYTPEEAAANQL